MSSETFSEELKAEMWANAKLTARINKLERRVAAQRRRIARLIEICRKYKEQVSS